MPRLSLVVPAYKVQGYLRECLESVLDQGYTDFEVIAVDDCSPDASGAIMDEFAARDDRVQVLHLPENVGLGRARNAGMAEASGDYLIFLDSDDTLVPDSLAAIARRLEETGDPDILIFDYARTYWDGRVERNHRSALLAETGPPAFPLSERPELLDLLQTVWNKTYRRDFVAKHGFEFPTGYYEDAPWTYLSLLRAERIGVLDRVCVHYRQRRSGNILRTQSRKHFDIFDQYRAIFDYLDMHPELENWRPEMFRKMIGHYVTVLDKPDRLPTNARGEFLRRASEDYRRRKPEGFTPPPGRMGKKFALIALGSHAADVSARGVAKVRRQVRSTGRRQVRRAKRRARVLYYATQRRLPLDTELAVFSAYWSRGYACNPAAIDAELARRAPHIRRVWVVRPQDADRIPEGVRAVRLGSPEYWAAIARARYLVNNVNFSNELVKREGSIHLQTHHGTPLKSMGLDQRRYPASAPRMSFGELLQRCDRWDYSLSANRFSSAIWERVYPCDYTTLELGYPRNDVLYQATAEDVRQARRDLGLADDTTAFLYMPTHREYQPEFVPRLDLARLATALGDKVTLLVRGHYFYRAGDRLAELRATGRIVDVSDHPRVEQLYLAADALVTDYSSAMFDYAHLDRPIVIYADDWETYSAVRGTYFDLPSQPPGAVARTQRELTEILRTDAWRDDSVARLRGEFRKRFCDFDDGRAAERVVRHVFLGEDLAELPPVVPLEQRTPAPSPSQALELVERV